MPFRELGDERARLRRRQTAQRDLGDVGEVAPGRIELGPDERRGIAEPRTISGRPSIIWWNDVSWSLPLWSAPLTIAIGLGLLLLTLHAARGIGYLHGQLAKQLLVKTS